MNKEEIKIITLGDIFQNLETEEQAFEFLKYIKNLQQENQELELELSGYRQAILEDKEMLGLKQENQKYKEVIDKAIEFSNKNWGTWCSHHIEYMTELQNILKEGK